LIVGFQDVDYKNYFKYVPQIGTCYYR